MIRQPEKHIIILHGWGSSPMRWDEFTHLLKTSHPEINYSLHVPHLPGFDPQNPITHPLTIDDYSEWLSAYIAGLKLTSDQIKNLYILGHSHGGRIALRFSAQTAQQIPLLLLGSAGIPNDHLSLKRRVFKKIALTGKSILNAPILRALPGINHIQTFAQKLLYRLAREGDYLNASPVLRETMKNILVYNARQDLPKIKSKVWCIWGDVDPATPLWMGKEISESIPGASLTIIKGGGHNLHRTHARELTEIVTRCIIS